MPELPEVEVLVRLLHPLLRGRTIREVTVNRPKIIAPDSTQTFARALQGATFQNLRRRGKYLVFELHRPRSTSPLILLGHLGMTGRMYLLPEGKELPRHVPVSFRLTSPQKKAAQFVFEDTRYFGRMTLDGAALQRLGPEPLGPTWTPGQLHSALARSAQPIKVRLLDQELVAGVGNIYASEALFLARISPRRKGSGLSPEETTRLWQAIREVLTRAIAFGSTVPLDLAGEGEGDRLFYYGRAPEAKGSYEERLQVYDRAGQPCLRCGSRIRRIIQGGRSTFLCPACQKR